jgi:hypothetical protein
MTFDEWLRSFPWLHQPNRQCLVSTDLDGVSCALLQSIELNWSTVGTYDGKLLTLYVPIGRVDWENVVFIDVEVLRSSIHSIGNHLFAMDGDDVRFLRSEFPHCASPNLWRGINVNDSFQGKYPFGTLPLLIASHALRDDAFDLHRLWLALMLHTDSSLTNAARYQANALDWLAAMDTGGRVPGLDRMCRRIKRTPGETMLSLLDEVQRWAAEAGFGGLQRPCRFDPRNPDESARMVTLIEKMTDELGVSVSLPFGSVPIYSEEFETCSLANHTVGRRRDAFARARRLRALSMAATGRTATGLSVTRPNADSPIVPLR